MTVPTSKYGWIWMWIFLIVSVLYSMSFNSFVAAEEASDELTDINVTANVTSPFLHKYHLASYNAKEHAKLVYEDKNFRDSLRKYGVAHISGAIPPELVRRVLYDANKRLSTLDHKSLGFNDPAVGHFSYDTDNPIYYELFDKSLLPHLYHHLLGNMSRPYQSETTQVTFRFPGMFCGKDDYTKRWHIDGVGPQSNDDKTIRDPGVYNFDALTVILLSDTHGKYSGELGAYPESHLRLASYLTPERLHAWRHKGIGELPINDKSDAVVGNKTFHLLGKAGDVYIVNYMIAHYPTCNESPYIRYNMYCRVNGPTFPDRQPKFERPDSMFKPLQNWRL